MTTLPDIDNARARAIFLDRHGLAHAPSGPGKGADLQGVIDALGFVQIDSINTVARAHHMTLHARRAAYRARHLDPLHEKARGVFEHWTHDASLIAMQHFPHWRLRFARHAAAKAEQLEKWRAEGFDDKIDGVLRHIAEHGPCCSSDVGLDEARSGGGWWDWHPSKVALEYLWRTGVLSVTRRTGFRKVYDLTENVIPPEYMNAHVPVEGTIDWACRSALDRLGFATSGELAAFWALITPAEAKAWCAAALDRGEIVEALVHCAKGAPRKSYVWPQTLRAEVAAPTQRMRVLSPFDPVLRDRKRAERLFGFFYRIEIYVPAPKRQYGYYVFPLIEGDKLVGRVDMKAERDRDRLHIKAFWPERGVKFGAARTARLETALARSARLAEVGGVTFENGWLKEPL